jgi:SAM-dependent methyltransferase
MTDAPAGSPRPGPRTVEDWAAHWNAKATIENPIELNGFCIDGVALDAGVYRRAVIEPWIELLDVSPEHHVLEVGCGSGQLLDELTSRAARTVGTDISEVLIERYRGDAETYVCAAHELPFKGEQFDRILMASVSHYFPSLEYFASVVAGLVALLRTRGRLLIADVLLGPQPDGTPYLWYEPMDVIHVLEPLAVGFSIEAQSALKRTINRRYDIVIRKGS